MPDTTQPANPGNPADRGSTSAAAPGPALTPPGADNITALRRIPLTADVLAPATPEQTAAFQKTRLQSLTHFYLALNDATKQLELIGNLIPARPLPAQLLGTLVEPDSGFAAGVQVSVDVGGSHYTAITNDQGAFSLSLPPGNSFPESNTLTLLVHGANANTSVTLSADKIAANGLIGNIPLPIKIDPLPLSIVGSLKALLPAGKPSDLQQAATPPAAQPQLTLGDDGQCQLMYRTDYTVERFPYAVFFRLVEPRTSIVTSIFRFPGANNNFFPITQFGAAVPIVAGQVASFVDRMPVEQPISVDGFRDQIIGVDGGVVVGSSENVPMAGTLGLGYMVQMAQSWTPKGYALGNLVYSLPLAPGEQERVAIFERVDTASVRESEFLTEEEQQSFQQTGDTSAQATFSQAFNESARGGSHFDTQSSSSSWGASFIIASGGGGSSQSSGNSNTWLEGQRDLVQRATEDMHSAVQRHASARRSAFRTSMRLATATESENVTTKTITNHNHTHALTLQYWEVQRLFEVSTAIDGVTLVCLVPLEVVRFLPPGQPITLNSSALVTTRDQVLRRYSLVLKHADVLARSLPREHQYGLTLLTQFAGDPTAQVQPAGGAAEDVIQFTLTGTFLPMEDIYVTAVTRRGTRLGPVRLAGSIPPVPDKDNDPRHAFSARDELIGYLRDRRSGANIALSGNLAIPPALARNDIVGFELSRRFRTYDYDLVNPSVIAQLVLAIQAPAGSAFVTSTVHLSPTDLERELGGPTLENLKAVVLSVDGTGTPTPNPSETYLNDPLSGAELPPTSLPLPALQLAPVLRYSQILEIEKMLQHVVRNTVTYSKAVWWSLTPEERAIMLEAYTIGVPPGGIADETQMIPLLNCVENRVLGFYGNSMMMPFIIPRAVADTMNITSKQVQDTLAQFHKTAFDPPKAVIALPTRGVLGEAVLGHCSSAEKIDLTRFWNWQDSASDTAPEVAPVTLPTTQPSVAAGLTGPSALPGLQPMIQNFNAGGAAPSADTSLLQSMIKAASEQKDFSTDLTGASILGPLIKSSQETAEKARADALKTTKDLTAQAMATVGNIYGGMKGNPTAGSDALKAVSGGDSGKSDTSKSKDGQKTGTGFGSGGGGSSGNSGSGGGGNG